MATVYADSEERTSEDLEERELPRGEGGGGGNGDEDEDDDDEEEGGEAWKQPLTELRDQITELKASTETRLDSLATTAQAIKERLEAEPAQPTPQTPPGEPTADPQESEPKPDEKPKPNEASDDEEKPATSASANGEAAKKFRTVLHRRRSI